METFMTTRRDFVLQSAGAAAAAGVALSGGLSGLRTQLLSTSADAANAANTIGDGWVKLLGSNLDDGKDYALKIEGRIPEDLSGVLYRNGPGLFERNGFSKKHLLDGDGMIQEFQIADGRARYRNKFVRTEKYLKEEAAGKFLYPTWTTLAPNFLDNIPGIPSKSQAGVTVYMHENRLFAIDEVGPMYELDPATLETTGAVHPDQANHAGTYKAHTKIDGRNGDWIFVGWSAGRSATIDVIVRDKKGNVKSHTSTPSPRGGYIHDFFATEKYVVINLHAITASPFGMLAGLNSFTDGMSWTPEVGNLLIVLDKAGAEEPIIAEAPPTWMWHAFNAYEQGDDIIADFIGYDNPDHFIGQNPMFETAMKGRLGDTGAPGTMRRYVINLTTAKAREEIVSTGSFEFPMINWRYAGYNHRLGYACASGPDQWFQDGVARIDFQTGALTEFHFGPGVQVGEPIFAPKPNATYAPSASTEDGYLLSVCLDGHAGNSFLAIFNAAKIADGPVAKAMLTHHTPLSFHGYWRQA
jgi:all-trans-8'-apo-beta-carotenal 15,15'-oxygenase